MKLVFTFIVTLIQLTTSLPIVAEDKWFDVTPATSKIVITGFTYAQAKMPLTSEVSGKVSEIFADVGESISETKKFACLDDTFTQIDIKSAKREMSKHYVDIKYYKKQVARHEKLVKRQTMAVSTLDELTRNLSSSREALSIATIRKDRLEELQRRHCIEASEGWLVIDRNIELGQWVREGEIVAHIGNYSQLKVPVTLSHAELASLKKNKEKIELVFEESNIRIPAVIEHISPAFDEKTRKILVDLLIDKGHHELHGGMRVSLSLEATAPSINNNAFIINKLALEERYEAYWVQRKDGKNIRVKVLSEQADGRVMISSRDIKLGDQFKRVGN